jgi:hypothetical protein
MIGEETPGRQNKMTVVQGQQAVFTKERQLTGAILAAAWQADSVRAWDPALFCNIDWPKLQNLAWQYKIRPMAAAALREAGWPGVPPQLRAAVEEAERKCALKTMWQMSLLAEIARTAAGLRFIALKGFTLSLRLYGNPFIREAFDLDILVPPQDVRRFQEIVLALQCREKHRRPMPSPRQQAILDRYHHDLGFIHGPSGTVLEIHRSQYFNRFMIGTDFEALWSARETVSWGGTAVAVLGEEDLVHSLVMHAARHGWERWKWLADLAALAGRADADRLARWRQRAAREGNADIFDSWLLLSRTILATPLPQQALEAAQHNRRAAALAARALRLSGRDYETSGLSALSYMFSLILHRALLKRSLCAIAVEIGSAIHNERDVCTLRLPDCLFWLYYVLRPFLFLWRRGCVPLAGLLCKRGEDARTSGAERL